MQETGPRQRLTALAAERGVSLSRLSRLIGRNSSYLQQFVRKGSPRKLEETDRRTLARFFGVSEAELGAPEEKYSNRSENGPRGDWIAVPRLALEASAGPGTLAPEEEPIGAFGFSARWLRERGLDPAALSTIAVEGDSMEPLLNPGDEILVDRTARPLRDGIHVLRIGEALHVKRVQRIGPDRLQLISANEAYPPVELALAEVDIIGRVVWKSGRL